MPGTRKQLVILVVAMLAAPRAAAAFHAGSMFDRAPGGGGGGGLFFTGAPRERGWTCGACHVDAPGRLRLDVAAVPGDLFARGTYQPGQQYTLTVAMQAPATQLGLGATRSNFNGMAVSVLDGAGAGAGVIGGLAPGRFYARGTSIVATDSPTVNETSWTFTWTAPPAGTGPVGIYLGVVDGNGAGGTGVTTLTDPLGDDVATWSVILTEGGAAQRAPIPAGGRARSRWSRERAGPSGPRRARAGRPATAARGRPTAAR
ncbi:MAG: choice-of-anchor V domain-containing protein [Kofleriaceae bacterium]